MDAQEKLICNSDEQVIESPNSPAVRAYCSCRLRRFHVCILGGIGLFNVCAMRVNLSVAMEPMACQYNWDSFTQGAVFASFFAGYVFGNIPGGYLATKFGGKSIFGLGVLCTALFSFLIPICTSGFLMPQASLNCSCRHQIDWCFADGTFTNAVEKCISVETSSDGVCNEQSFVPALAILRFLMGVVESVTLPALFSLLNHWTPKNERSTMFSISCSGSALGTIVGFPVSSLIIASAPHGFLVGGGWQNVFYLFGTLAIGWWLLWMWLIFDSPVSDPFISIHERRYLLKEIPKVLLPTKAQGSEQHDAIPWMAFFREPAAWAIYIAHFSFNWSFYTLQTELPTYLNNELHFDLASAGFVSVLPYLSNFIMTLVASVLVDKVITTKLCTRTYARKFVQTVSSVIPGALFVLCGYSKSALVCVILLSVANALMGVANSGYVANVADISPTYSGLLYGISNTISTLPGVISPLLTGYILSGDNSQEEWRIVFYISFSIFAFGTVVFWMLATGEKVESLNQTCADFVDPLDIKKSNDQTNVFL